MTSNRSADQANSRPTTALVLTLALLLTAGLTVSAVSPGTVVVWGDNFGGRQTFRPV